MGRQSMSSIMQVCGCGCRQNMWSYYILRVLMQEPVMPGCFLRTRAIGLMPMIDQGEKDDKIIAVSADDQEYRHFTDINQLAPHRLAEIRRFFEDCKKNENKEVAVNEFLPTSTAHDAIQHSMKALTLTHYYVDDE